MVSRRLVGEASRRRQLVATARGFLLEPEADASVPTPRVAERPRPAGADASLAHQSLFLASNSVSCL